VASAQLYALCKSASHPRQPRKHENEIAQIVKQMVTERQDISGSNCLKGVSRKLIVDEKGIRDSWKEYMEN